MGLAEFLTETAPLVLDPFNRFVIVSSMFVVKNGRQRICEFRRA